MYVLKHFKLKVIIFLASGFIVQAAVAQETVDKKDKVAIAAQQKSEKNNTESISVLIPSQEDDLVAFFSKPIDFSADGIEFFFKKIYNNPKYSNYVAYNLSHMIQLLDYGVATDQGAEFAASVLSLFLQKIKAAPFIQAEAFLEFIPQLARSIKPYLEKKEVGFVEQMQITLKDKLTDIFSKYFSYFQKNPDEFLSSLAHQIAQQANHGATKHHIEIAELKKDVLRFFEIAANKLVWAAGDDIGIWRVCNQLADQCSICLSAQILPDQNGLNDVCWSIIHRFCYFLELFSASLSLDFYNQILMDLKNQNSSLVKLPELEDACMNKLNYVQDRVAALSVQD